MYMGGASPNAVARHFNVHRTIVQRFLIRLEKVRPTRDRPYSGRPRVMTPYQDREIRPTHMENRFGIVKHTAGTIHGRHSPMIGAKTVYVFLCPTNKNVPKLYQNDARHRVFRRPRARYHNPCIQQIDGSHSPVSD